MRPHGLYSPWNSLGQNTGVGSLSRLQGIFPTQGWNLGLPHCRQILYQLSHQGSPCVSAHAVGLSVTWPRASQHQGGRQCSAGTGPHQHGSSRCRAPTEEPDVRSQDLRSCPSSHCGLCSSSRSELWAAGPHTGGPGPFLAPAPGLLVDLPTGSLGLQGSSSPFLSSPLAISQFFSPHAENKSSLQFSFPLLL